MKKLFNSILAILGGALFCIAFASCENFLKGADIKKQLDEAVEIANSSPVTIYVIADEGSGLVTPSQLRVKKNETFDIMFNPADSRRFVKWEVLDRQTKEPVTDVIQFEKETALETKGKVLVAKENLEIHPKTILLPVVTDVIPSSTGSIPANQPIIITFNMAMEDENATPETSLFNYDNISITNNGNSITHLFQKPVFDSDKKVLTIRPNAAELKNYIVEQNKENLDVKVLLSESIKVQIEGESLSLVQNEKSSFSVRYNKAIETIKPADYGFFVTAKNISLDEVATLEAGDKFVLKNNLNNDEEILKNRNNGTIFIYGKYFDEDSGVGKIRVVEQKTNTKAGRAIYIQPKQTDFYLTNQDIVYSTKDNYTSFIIKYVIQDAESQEDKDGAFRFDVTVYDYSENAAPTYSFTVIKDSFIDITDVELYNFNEIPYPASVEDETNGDYITSYHSYPSYRPGFQCPFREDYYEENLKIVKLRSLHKRVYANTYLPDNDFTVSVTYLGNTELMTYDQNSSKWSLPLQVNDIANLSLKLCILDKNGLSAEKDFCFPPDPEVDVTVNEYNYPIGYFRLRSGLNITAWNEFAFIGWAPETTEDNPIPDHFYFFQKTELPNGYAAKTVIPNGSSNGVFYVYQNKGLWGNRCKQWFAYVNFQKDENIPSPQLLSVEKQRSTTENYMDIVVTIPASLWDTYDFDEIGIFRYIIDPRTEDTPQKIKQRLEDYSDDDELQGFIERGETTKIVLSDFFTDAINIHTYYFLRGKKGDKYSLVSNPIRVKGLNSESIETQHELINIKPVIYTREEFYDEVKQYYDDYEATLYGYHHGSEGDNTIYYKGAPDCCEYFYPLSVYFPDTESSGEEWYYLSYAGDKVIVRMNNVVNTYNFDDLAFKYNENNYYGDSSYDDNKFEYYYQLLIPLVEMDSDYNELEITVTTDCGTSMTYSTIWERKPIPIFNDFSSSGSYIYSDVGYQDNYESGEWAFIVNKFNKTSSKWVNQQIKYNANPSYYSDGEYFEISKSSLSIPSSSFIKVITKAAVSHEDNSYWDAHYSDSVYHWTGTKSSGDATDFLLEQNDFYLVASDQPVLIHTIVTKQPYENCKNWDAEKWERNHRIVSEKQLDFSTSNSGSKKYKPVLTSLSSGDCYVIVAHFGDDHVEMSNVKQMP